MPIQNREMREIKRALEAELMCKTINQERKLAIEQELQSIKKVLRN